MGKAKSTNKSNEQPWFADGLKFKCTGCGDCCTGSPGYVWLNQAEIDAMAGELELSPKEFERRYVRNIGIRRSLKELPVSYDCVFLDAETRKCEVYATRPRQCRTWPFWDSNLKSPETWQETCEACPGAGKGKLYSLEHIQSEAAVVHV
ncbi:YkgJ family cysteine cluster protein [Adhaeretor mobilis]|uniref:Flagellin N-methylase n=1 Tax=Adhaeretor mobilis TaxID=1930276 RepID=A0A517MUI7_9BACT|nr:YkgJ family cysteine cluster protein [Adhaeretor mobilis]QDS98551.1 Flagellin N-methylase [Adhaeretor mobilis]